jgi:enoyl-[acyl-carrier protein] reductase I
MIESDRTYIIMGLLDPDSIAFAVGEFITKLGGKVVYTVQNERMKRIFLDRTKKLTDEQKAALDLRYCDVTIDEEVKTLFDEFDDIAGVLHSIAYANPKTCLGPEYHTDAYEDLKNGFIISCVSLATVTRYATPKMKTGGSIVALTFASERAFAFYNWMSVNKAALEANVRGLARRHGRDEIRVNALSAGPLSTKAASSIPGFDQLGETWENSSALPWDPVEDRQAVAESAAFLLGPCARRITGQTIYVDGGASIIGGVLLPAEKGE